MGKFSLVFGLIFTFVFKLGFLGFLLGLIIGSFLYGIMIKFLTAKFFKKDEVQYYDTLFESLGHVMKVKGVITSDDITFVEIAMVQLRFSEAQKKRAQDAFSRGKDPKFPLQTNLETLYKKYRFYRQELRRFLLILIRSSLNNGKLDPKTEKVLRQIAKTFKIRGFSFSFLLGVARNEKKRFDEKSRYKDESGNFIGKKRAFEQAYKTLGLTEEADFSQVKRAYRKLMSEYHPDKLASKGLSNEELEKAKNKAQMLQSAYDLIKQEKI